MLGDGRVATRLRALAMCLPLRAALARKGTAWVVVTCAFACGDDGGKATAVESATFFVQTVPVLGCFEPVASQGSCQRRNDCELQTRCALDTSVAPIDRAPVSLHCAPQVGPRPALARCDQGAQCESGMCALTGMCIEPCVVDEDCTKDAHCRPIEVRTSSESLQPTMACARRLALPADVQVSAAPNGQALRKGTNDVMVAGTTQPSLVYIQGECSRSLDVLSLRSLDLARDVYDRKALGAGKRAENTILHDGSALVALQFPNNPQLAPSLHGLTVGVSSNARQHAEVVIASRSPGAGMLDLNLFYVGGGAPLVPGGFRPGERRVAGMLKNFDRRLRTLGLSLGEVREFDVVGSLREELAVLEVPVRKVGEREVEGRPQRLDELFRLSAGLDTPGVNVFLISDMSSYIGIAGGIPGTLGVHGSARSGVALATDLLGDLDDTDLVLMHEIGHYLGLFHTTESSGAVLDPLADTAECSSDHDKDEDHELSADDCWDVGADNLMFWSGAGTSLTEEQIAVIASSVVLR